MSKVGQVYTAEDVLQWEESRLMDFLEKCPREGDGVLDISEVKAENMIDNYVQATKEYRHNEELWRKQKKRAA
ncbi:hypothetical protein NHJ13734_008070 [Beauveria thailandica]